MLANCYSILILDFWLKSENSSSLRRKSETYQSFGKLTFIIRTKAAINWFVKAVNWPIKTNFRRIKKPHGRTDSKSHKKFWVIEIKLNLKNRRWKIISFQRKVNGMEIKFVKHRARKVLNNWWTLGKSKITGTKNKIYIRWKQN